MKEIKNILVIRPDAIGDCILITPAIAALKKAYPQAKITVLIGQLTYDVFAGSPHVNEIIIDPLYKKKILRAEFWEFVSFIRAKNFDLSVHFFNEPPYASLAFFARIKYRLGDKSKPLIAWMYNLKGFQNWRDITKHEVEHNLTLLKPLKIPIDAPKMEIYPAPQALASVKKLLAEHQIKPEDKIAVMHLSTGGSNRPWLPERFGEVAKFLTNELGYKVVASGQARDKALIAKAQPTADNKIIDLSTKTNLSELIALISLAKLYISVDTGPYHIAAALGIPMVAIFTGKAALPLKWGPWGTRHVVVRQKTACQEFCSRANCHKVLCAEEIKTEAVISAVKVLEAGGGNKDRSGTFLDWCQKSLNIMIAYKPKNRDRAMELKQLLEQNLFFVTAIDISQPQRFLQTLRKNDITLIHAVDGSIRLRLAAIATGTTLPYPVLYIKDKPGLKNLNDLITYYCQVSENSVLF